MNDHLMSRNELRKIMCERRRALDKTFVETISRQLAAKVLSLPAIQNAQRIAGYFANGGEIDPAYIAEKLVAQEKCYYLPALDVDQRDHLTFIRYQPGDMLVLNRYKIPEPDLSGKKFFPQDLDVVLMPLVAFDHQGGRLGMGKGYYDRTFEFTKTSSLNKPLLIGLAYEFQYVDRLELKEWDVPLDAVVTEEKIRMCHLL